MKTAEEAKGQVLEILDNQIECDTRHGGVLYGNSVNELTELIEQAQTEAYNQALEDGARLFYDANHKLLKEILTLKK